VGCQPAEWYGSHRVTDSMLGSLVLLNKIQFALLSFVVIITCGQPCMRGVWRS
jgi:hypothetical protein